MEKILITGAFGLIGQYLCSLLTQEKSYEVYVITHNTKNRSENCIFCDLSQPLNYKLLPEKIDIIVHLAMSNFYSDFPENSMDIFNVNVSGTQYLLEYARRAHARKFIFTSSGGIYGNVKIPIKESSLNFENSRKLPFFLTTKLCTELVCNNYISFFSVDILRVFFAYGKGQKKNMLISRLVENVKNGIPITLQGKNGIFFNPINAEDAAIAIHKCFGLNENHVINLAGNEILSIKELGLMIGRLLKKDPYFKIEDKTPQHLVADNSKMRQLLHSPQISMERGLRSLIFDIPKNND